MKENICVINELERDANYKVFAAILSKMLSIWNN